MSFLRALRAYIGLGPDEDIEDRYLYELNSRRRELDLDEIEAEEIHLDAADAPVGLELESDDVVIVTPGGGRTNVPRSRSGGADRARHARPRGGSRPAPVRDAGHAGARSRPASLEDVRFERDDTGDRYGGDIDLNGLSDGMEVVEGTGGVFGNSADGEHDGEGILDFLEDETFVDDEPAPRSRRSTGRNRPADDRRDRAARTLAEEQPPPPVDAVVRSLDSMRAKPRTLIPESFADAKLVADEFKRDIPVLLNLQGLERDLARRLIDFASGICYAMDGSMEKIASQVFLLIPESVVVSDEDRRRIEERGYAR